MVGLVPSCRRFGSSVEARRDVSGDVRGQGCRQRFVRSVQHGSSASRRAPRRVGSWLYVPYNRSMAVTVNDIVAVPGMPLKLLAGTGQADRPIRWVHVSELEDPTPWLKGGELILTTGMGIGATPAKQRAYIKRLAKAGLAGLGFGLGFSHDKTPRSLVTAVDIGGLPAVRGARIRCRSSRSRRRSSRASSPSSTTRCSVRSTPNTCSPVRSWRARVSKASRGRSPTSREGGSLLLDLHGLPIAEHRPRGGDARRTRVGGAARRPPREHLVQRDAGRPGPSHLGAAGRRARSGRGVPRRRQARAAEPDGPDRRRPCAEPVRDRAREVASGGRRAAAAPGRLLRRTRARRPVGRRCGPRARAVRVRHATRRCSSSRSRAAGRRPTPTRSPSPRSMTASRAGGGFLASAHDDGVHLLLPAEPAIDLAGVAKCDRPARRRGAPSGGGLDGGSGRGRAVPARVEVRAPGVPARGLVGGRVRRPRHAIDCCCR